MLNFKKNKKINLSSGFSFVELIVGTAVFLVIVVAVYNSYIAVFDVVRASRAKIEAVHLINEQLEIVRNLPYADVGVQGSIPNGVLLHSQTIVRDAYSYIVTLTVRNVDDPFDGLLGESPNDLSPADYKLVEIELTCVECKNFTPMTVTTRVAPKNLETASTNGALFVRVFDANGNPVSGANVRIENNSATPPIVIEDVTNVSGVLQIVDAPPGVNVYEITVTKSGYTTDSTRSATVSNPDPVKPHATVLLQEVTQVSFIIDRISTFNISSLTDTCTPVGNIDFSLTGTRLVGNPSVLKYDEDLLTSALGLLTLNNIEWDSYSFVVNDAGYDLVGMSPISPINILPNSNQDVKLIVAPKNSRTLLVIVKDSVTGLPLSGVTAQLVGPSFDQTKITGEGFLGQTDWSGGSGQATSTNEIAYFSSDGNIETNNPAGDVLLQNVFGDYVSFGFLESSSFDTGGSSNYQKIDWNPVDQPVDTGTPNVRVQLATNNDGGVWNFTGPDGTSGTYYTTSDQNIHSSNNGNRYFRYKLFLDTAVTTASPNVSNIAVTFTSLCTPPGQVSFQGLSSGTYTLSLSKTGFVSQNIDVNMDSDWKMQEVIFVPN